MGSSAASRTQHSQDISWQARQKTPGLVRPPTTRSYILLWAEETKPTRECCKPGALDPHCGIQRCTQTAKKTHLCTEVRLVRKEGSGAAASCWQKPHEGLLQWTAWKCGDSRHVQLNPTDGMETFSESKELWQDGENTYRSYSTSLATYITKLWTTPAAHYQDKSRWHSNHGCDGWCNCRPERLQNTWEVLKYLNTEETINILHQLFTNVWEVGYVPQAWTDASIVIIYKTGDRTDCGNYRGISLLSAASKIFARILLNRISNHITPEVVPETQCGFRGNRSTVGIILCLRQLQEKCVKHDRPLFMVFDDVNKAFDTVGRTWLCQLLRKYECPETFTTMIVALHTGSMANVSVGGEVLESFSVTNGVKQRLCSGLHALLHLLIKNARRGFPRHGGWRLYTVLTERWPIQRRTSQSEDHDCSDTGERDAIRRWQCTGCTLCWRDAEHNGSRRSRCCTNPTLREPERRISWLMETSWTLFWN